MSLDNGWEQVSDSQGQCRLIAGKCVFIDVKIVHNRDGTETFVISVKVSWKIFFVNVFGLVFISNIN